MKNITIILRLSRHFQYTKNLTFVFIQLRDLAQYLADLDFY